MVEEINVANTEQETTPVQDAEVDSSPTETQDEEATSQKATEELPFHEHPRWQEIQDEKRALREANERLQQQLTDVALKVSTPKDTEDPYAGLSDEERAFYKNLDSRYEQKFTKIVDKVRKEERQAIQQELQGYQKMVGSVLAERFLDKHPDISKGSPEMKNIVVKAQREASLGKDLNEALDDAYKVVMYERNAQRAADKEREKYKQKIKDKAAANVEQKSIPSQNLPPAGNQSFIEVFDQVAKESGLPL